MYLHSESAQSHFLYFLALLVYFFLSLSLIQDQPNHFCMYDHCNVVIVIFYLHSLPISDLLLHLILFLISIEANDCVMLNFVIFSIYSKIHHPLRLFSHWEEQVYLGAWVWAHLQVPPSYDLFSFSSFYLPLLIIIRDGGYWVSIWYMRKTR